MNQVSWRRILQRAGSDIPGEDGAAVIKMPERAPERRGPAQAPARPPQAMGRGDLEAELKRALDRAQRHQREARPAAPPPGWDPIFVAEELPVKKAPAPARARSLVAPQAPAPSKRGGNGARNVIAISLSVAVIGLAVQQIGSQWSQSRDTATAEEGPDSIPEFNAATAVLHSGGVPAKNERRARLAEPEAAAPEPSSPRPSAVAEPQSPPERDAFFQEIEEASKILQAKQQAAQLAKQQAKQQVERVAALPAPPSTPVAAAVGSEEQSMLRRGRDLIERGHVNGARMIFEHLASQQSALGAFALAQTYDATFLAGLPVVGLEPDPKMAALWYQRAAEMSSGPASR